jgi:hypothetical protein
MQSGGQLQPDGTPAAGSVMAPEALPRPEPAQPRSFEQLERALPGVVRGLDAAFAQPPTMENHARQEAAREGLDAFTAELNTALDRNARATLGVPELEPLDFGALLGRAREAFADPASIGEDGAHALAAQVNQALDRNWDQALHERDEFEAALVQQARQRRQQRQEGRHSMSGKATTCPRRSRDVLCGATTIVPWVTGPFASHRLGRGTQPSSCPLCPGGPGQASKGLSAPTGVEGQDRPW